VVAVAVAVLLFLLYRGEAQDAAGPSSPVGAPQAPERP
jgi:hypothetical protein